MSSIHPAIIDSRIFPNVGIREIGLRSSLNERGGLTFGAGIISADFQHLGKKPSLRHALKTAHIGRLNSVAKSRRIPFGNSTSGIFSKNAEHKAESKRYIVLN